MRSLAVVGLGLIGTSVIQAAKRRWPDVHPRGISRTDSLDAVTGCEVVVLATPVDAIIDILPKIKPLIGPDTLVIDAGSTKRAILAAASGMPQFVGGHPMAGGTEPGPAGAKSDLFDGRAWFLMNPRAQKALIDRAAAFVSGLGATPVVMDDDGRRHDEIVAAVSHLPQVVASALMVVASEAVGPDGLQWAGSGLRDTTRLARSHSDMWMSILATNKDQVRPLLKQLAMRLDIIADHLDDRDAVRQLFDDAVRAKSSCL